MSFFKKLTSDFKNMTAKDEGSHDRGAAEGYYASHDQQYPPQQPSYGQSQQYPPQQSNYGHGQQYPPQQSNYGHGQQYPPQQSGYGHESYPSRSAGYGAPSHGGPQLPPGWEARFDPTTNRQYYVAILSQWEPPSYGSGQGPSASFFMAPPGSFVPQAGGGHGDRGMFGGGGHGAESQHGYGGGYGGHGGHGGHDQYGHGGHKDDGNKKMMMGAAGGLAVGAIGGAIVAHELTEDEHGNPVQVTQTYPPPAQTEGYGEEPLPTTDADGDSVSGSDREDVEEAREDLQEAEREGSQSDIEEAREEYQEEYEETYDD